LAYAGRNRLLSADCNRSKTEQFRLGVGTY
jgi:hypothetical protein